MKKLLSLSVTLLLAAASLAAETPAAAAKPAKPKLTKEQRRERFLRVTGGRIQRPGTFTGRIAIIDTQSRFKTTAVTNLVSWFVETLEYNVCYVRERPLAAWTWQAVPDLMKRQKADIAIVLLEDPAMPPMLNAVEQGWSVVNVAALDEGLPKNALSAKMFEQRCEKETFRAFSMVCGGFCSPYSKFALNAATVAELDTLANEMPFDNMQLYKTYLAKRGVTPKEMVTYREAYFEGWAPAPTNEYQRACFARCRQIDAEEKAEAAKKAAAAQKAAAAKNSTPGQTTAAAKNSTPGQTTTAAKNSTPGQKPQPPKK